jgi:hypothetical protein
MNITQTVTDPVRGPRVRRQRWGCFLVTAFLASLAALAAFATTAGAASQSQLPFRCFAQVGVDHVVFGPDSFFLPKTVQGQTSFSENAGPTIVTYPLYHGTSQGRDVSYVITDASDRSVAEILGVNYVPKLAQAAGTAAVQSSSSEIGSGNGIDFPASVDFSPTHVIVPSATGFPPLVAQPGAVGEQGYSPLVQVVFRDQTVVLNAPQIANATGQADKVVSIADNHRTVSYRETDGCYDNESVHTRPSTPPTRERRRSRMSPMPLTLPPHPSPAAPTPPSSPRTAHANR